MDTQKQGKQPATGKIWHNADSQAEAEQWRVDLLAKGAIHVELKPEAGRGIVSVIITLDRSRANEILGYEAAEEEWLDVSEVEQGKVSEQRIKDAKQVGFKVHCGEDNDEAPHLVGRWWWSLCNDGWSGIDVSPEDYATEELAWDAAITLLDTDPELQQLLKVPEPAEIDCVETDYDALVASGVTDYCNQVCGGGNCGSEPLCQYGIDSNTHMPPKKPAEGHTNREEERRAERVMFAVYAAVDTHAQFLDIREADHETKVRQLLISLHEYCGIYAVDLVREFAEVRRLIDSGEIASPEWRKWNGPAAQPREMAGCLAMTDGTWGTKTPADGGSTESSNGLILVPPDDRTLEEKSIKTVFCIARTGDVGGVDWFATQDARVAAERFDGDVLFDLDVEIGLSPSEITRAADNMANNEMWLEEGSGCRKVTESRDLSESPVITLFEVMVKKALEEAKGLRVVFSTMLQNPDDVFREHSGQEAELIGVGIDPTQEDWDEEAMPFLKVRFADGVEIEAFGEELFSKDTRFFKLYSTVAYGYCAARTLQSDYVGPYHLAAEGADVDKQAFLDALSHLPELTQCDQAPWTPEAFRVDAQKAA